MATNMYLNFEDPGAEGESTDSNHEKWIEVTSWQHEFHQPTSPVRSTGGGGTVERVNHSPFSFTKYIDSATDNLLKMCWSGQHVKKATFEAYRANGEGEAAKYLEILMEDVIVSNLNVVGSGGDIPQESVSLSYGKVTYTYFPQDKKTGSAGPAEPVSHDLESNTIE